MERKVVCKHDFMGPPSEKEGVFSISFPSSKSSEICLIFARCQIITLPVDQEWLMVNLMTMQSLKFTFTFLTYWLHYVFTNWGWGGGEVSLKKPIKTKFWSWLQRSLAVVDPIGAPGERKWEWQPAHLQAWGPCPVRDSSAPFLGEWSDDSIAGQSNIWPLNCFIYKQLFSSFHHPLKEAGGWNIWSFLIPLNNLKV